MTHGTGSPARIAQVLGLVFLLVYLVEIGLWRFLATAVLVAAFTAAVFGRGAWRHCAQAWTDLRTGRAEWTPLAVEAVVLTLLHAALVQAQNHGLLPARGGLDLGPALQALEGPWHLALPHPLPVWAAWSWLVLYLFAFPALLFGTVIALHGRRESAVLQRFLRAANLTAWSALPMFALVGVPEVWMQLTDYQPAVVTAGDTLAFYRLLSGPYNCLPSLHCVLAGLAAAACWRSGVPVLRWLGPVVALLVCLSTVAAGIHWVVDVVASLPWAAAAWALAGRRGPSRIAGVRA